MKHRMKRKCLGSVLALAALAFPLWSHAANNHYTHLVFDFKDGRQTSFLLAEKPNVDFAPGKMTVSAGTEIAVYDPAEVDNYHFSDIPTDISMPAGSGMLIAFTDNNHIEISGTEATQLAVYDASGKQTSSQCIEGGHATVDLSGKTTGVYIIKLSDGQNFKFLKK